MADWGADNLTGVSEKSGAEVLQEGEGQNEDGWWMSAWVSNGGMVVRFSQAVRTYDFKQTGQSTG